MISLVRYGYHQYVKMLKRSIRQVHRADEKLFVAHRVATVPINISTLPAN